jgi:PAS domain S-box-containing protein
MARCLVTAVVWSAESLAKPPVNLTTNLPDNQSEYSTREITATKRQRERWSLLARVTTTLAKRARRCRMALWLLAAGVCLAGGQVSLVAGADRVIILTAESPELPGSALIRQGIIAALRGDGTQPVDIFEETIDTSRFAGSDYEARLAALYQAKYRSTPPSLIITLAKPALDFMRRHRHELFRNTPILYGFVDERSVGARPFHADLTGVFVEVEARLTLETALALHPGTRRVVVVGGTSPFDRTWMDAIQQDLRALESTVSFTYLTDVPFERLLADVAGLGDGTLVLFATMTVDGDGTPTIPPDVVARLRGVSKVPIYGMASSFLGRGIVGGATLDLRRHGADIGQRARRLLAGEHADVASTRTPNLMAFDWRELQRFGIEEARLPAGSTIVNRELGLWDVHRRTILLVGAALVGQSLLIVALLVQRSRRRRVEQALRESEERFRLMADTAPVLVWRADTSNLCDFVNQPWLEFTGRTMEQEMGAGWVDGVCREDLAASLHTCQSAFDARQPFRMEFRLRRADGAYRWVLDTGVPRYGSDGSFAGYIGSCLDITERKASEDALRDNQQRYTMATAAGAVGVWDWNFETGDIYVDPTLKAILGFDDSEITTRVDDWGSRVYAGDLAMVTARTQACIDGLVDEYEVEHRMLHKDGSVRWFLSRGSLLRRADGAPQRMVGTKVDITERRRAEEAIREQEAVLRMSEQEIQQLVGRLIAAQEAERSRIARDLHDDTSQQLAGLAIALSGLKRRMGAVQGNEDLQGDVASLQERTIALTENVRHLSHDLHPSVLEHSGLVTALTTYCRQVQGEQSVVVTFTTEGDFEPAGKQVALCLYRIAQEALRNVVAHAGARRADVRLRRTGDGAELTIADDGKGFDIARTGERSTGLGLVSINERARLVGGTVSITTELNKGTRVRVQIPAFPHTRTGPGDVAGRYAASA